MFLLHDDQWTKFASFRLTDCEDPYIFELINHMKNLADMNWNSIYESLDAKGYALIPGILSPSECDRLRLFYDDVNLFRSTINMQRYRFGRGEYKYFSYPLPPVIQFLREAFYTPLARMANRWMEQLATDTKFPENHDQMIQVCHAMNQRRPTPLILRYETGGFNTLHQDLYGEVYFPFQILFALSQHGRDHEGGEFVLTEQMPRAQSRAEVIRPNQGDAVIFTTNFRPVKGTRGYYRARVKHGVSEIKSGFRYVLGVIFHDAN